MRKMLIAMTVLLCSAGWAFSQSPFKVHTSPKLPPRDALERMNLTQAWTARVHVDGQRDGVFSVQVIPGKPNQLVVQTYKGGVSLYDADNGDLVWKTQVGVPYWEVQPAGFNSQCIFVTRRNVLHVINRFTGSQRVYAYAQFNKEPTFGYELQLTPSAAPVADEEFLYVPMGSRLQAIYIPDFEGLERAKKAADALAKDEKKDPSKDEKYAEEMPPPNSLDSVQPFFYWGYRIPNQITDFPALFHGEQISMLTTEGTLASVNRFEKGARVENFEFKVTGRSPGGTGQHNSMAYVASDDFNLYAINMNGGALVWRHVSGAAILRKPEVNDFEVFIAPERTGLRKLDRRSGRELWTNRDTQRFLATNNQYVYALDRIGQFFVLDARRGGTMARLDLSDWTLGIANEWTDRIYLAANDGQILCLRHRDLTKPLVMKTVELPKVKEEKKEEKKEEEKKEEKKEAAKLGRLGLELALLRLSARRDIVVRIDGDWSALDDRRAWALR